jgi:hypothetical protein
MATAGNVTPATIVPEKGQPLLDCDGCARGERWVGGHRHATGGATARAAAPT